ncbi:MAG: hypothetical protein ACK4XY_07320 [Chloroherpetonaceae bacterium]
MLHACRDGISSELPITTIPNPPTNLQTTESLRYVKLTWNTPQTNIDGSPLTDLNSFQIYRRKLPESEFKLMDANVFMGSIWLCRCHGSEFDSQGNVVQPPATLPLTRLSAVRINDVGLTVRA